MPIAEATSVSGRYWQESEEKSMVYRVYVEKKAGQTHEADGLMREIREFLQIDGLTSVRVLNRYDAENLEENLFNYAVNTVFSEPQVDDVSYETPVFLPLIRHF